MAALPVIERSLHVEELGVVPVLVGFVVPPADDPRVEAVLEDRIEEPGARSRLVEIEIPHELVREVVDARLLAVDPQAVLGRVPALLGVNVDARLHDADQVHAEAGELAAELAARTVGKLTDVPAELSVVILTPGLPVEVEREGIERDVPRAVAAHDP